MAKLQFNPFTEKLDVTGGAGGGLTDPMTTRGDMIYRNAGNITARLPVGLAGYVLTSDGTDVSWQPNSASGFADPMTTRGDIIYRDPTNTTTRLPRGAANTALFSDGTDISWQPALSDPMTTAGDMLIRNGVNINSRLAVGTSGQYLSSNGTTPVWVNFTGVQIGDSPTWTGTHTFSNDTFVATTAKLVSTTGSGFNYIQVNTSGGNGEWGSRASLFAMIDSDNNSATAVFAVRTDNLVSNLFSIDESAQLILRPNTGITASTTQTQGQQPLTTSINEVLVVANPNDVVTLPSAAAGKYIEVINNGANDLQVFPSAGVNLGNGTNNPMVIPAGNTYIWRGINTGKFSLVATSTIGLSATSNNTFTGTNTFGNDIILNSPFKLRGSNANQYYQPDTGTGNGIVASRGSFFVRIDEDDNQANAQYAIQTNTGAVTLWSINELGQVTHTATNVAGASYELRNDVVTTGSVLRVISNSADSSTRRVVEFINDHATSTTATTLYVQQDGQEQAQFIQQNGEGIALWINSIAVNSQSLYIVNNVIQGQGLAFFDSNSTSTSARNLLHVRNNSSLATNATVLQLTQSSTATALNITLNNNGRGIVIVNANSTNNIIEIDANVLSTASIARFYSNSGNASARNLVQIINDNVNATATTPLYLQQDAPTSTNFYRYITLGTNTIWISDGTSPNGALTGTQGDICLNGPSGQTFYCGGGTTWTGM